LKRKKKHNRGNDKREKTEVDVDTVSHGMWKFYTVNIRQLTEIICAILFEGGWSKAEIVSDITGSVCIEFGNHTYVKALDNGCFTIGPPHSEGGKTEFMLLGKTVTISSVSLGFCAIR